MEKNYKNSNEELLFFMNSIHGTLSSLMTNRKNFELMNVQNIKFKNNQKTTLKANKSDFNDL